MGLTQTKAFYDARSGLLPMLRQNAFRDATKPHDRVFALLGLVRQDAWGSVPPVVVNYTIEAKEVYQSTTLCLIKALGTLDALCCDTGGEVHDTDEMLRTGFKDVPSWALSFFPRWMHHVPLASFMTVSPRCFHLDLYNASRGLLPSLSVHGDRVIALKGLLVDHVANCPYWEPWSEQNDVNHSRSYPFPKTVGSAIAEYRAVLDHEYRAYKRDRYPVKSEDINRAFWRTVCGDVVACAPDGGQTRSTYADTSYRRLTGEEIDMLAAGHQLPALCPDSPSPKQVELLRRRQFEERHNAFMLGRQFFVTKLGYIGFGPPETTNVPSNKHEEGIDVVAVLYGGRTPFVLRPKKPKGLVAGCEGVQTFYELVGDCYIHGIMDGELVKVREDILREKGPNGAGAKEQTFYLI